MKGDTGAFVTGLFDKLQTSAGALLTVESLRRGQDPKSLKKMQADAKAAATLFPLLGKHGFILAGELRELEPPQGQIFLILPGMGEKPEPLFGAAPGHRPGRRQDQGPKNRRPNRRQSRSVADPYGLVGGAQTRRRRHRHRHSRNGRQGYHDE